MDYERENNVDVFLLQETLMVGDRLYVFDFTSIRKINSYKEGPELAAIIVINSDIELVEVKGVMDRFIAVAGLRKGQAIHFVLAYIKYCVPTQHFVDRLDNILDLVGNNVVIGADVNSHSALWHSRLGGHIGMVRRTRVEKLIKNRHLKVYNRPGHIDMYDRPGMGASNACYYNEGGGHVRSGHDYAKCIPITHVGFLNIFKKYALVLKSQGGALDTYKFHS